MPVNKSKIETMFRRYRFDCISISSYDKKKLKLMIGHLVSETLKLRFFLHKIIYMRVLAYKSKLLFSLISYSYFIFSDRINPYLFTVLLLFSKLSDAVGMEIIQMFSTTNVFLNNIYVKYLKYVYTYISYVHTSIALHKVTSGAASLPTHIRKFTVLRSPHIDKRSREQFEIRTYKRAYAYIQELAPFYRYIYLSKLKTYTCSTVFSLQIVKYDSV
jgi:ribosomal protein S10